MHRSAVLLLRSLLLGASLAGCAGGRMDTLYAAGSPTPAPDVFTCVRDQVKAVGFSQDSYDTDELRVTAHKYNDKVRRPDVRFRRMVDRLAIDVGPGAADTVTSVSIQASTFVELSTHRGPTEEQERASETAKQAAQTILDRCGGSPGSQDSR